MQGTITELSQLLLQDHTAQAHVLNQVQPLSLMGTYTY
jgi:hypothetical protein